MSSSEVVAVMLAIIGIYFAHQAGAGYVLVAGGNARRHWPKKAPYFWVVFRTIFSIFAVLLAVYLARVP